MALGFVLALAAPGRAEPNPHGQIMARARVLAPVGQTEVAAYLARWESEQTVQHGAWVRLVEKPMAFEAVDVDHGRLRIRLLQDEDEPRLKIESLAN